MVYGPQGEGYWGDAVNLLTAISQPVRPLLGEGWRIQSRDSVISSFGIGNTKVSIDFGWQDESENYIQI